jgi:hypothetical protein
VRQVALLRAQPAQTELARLLDGLDAWACAEKALKVLPRLLNWGPKVVKGIAPSPWLGVVIWGRASGYSGYKTLTVRGIWLRAEGETTRLLVGQKRLPYAVEFYEAEAYHKLIGKNFDLYYRDDGAPPAGTLAFDAPYREEERLALRERLAALLLSEGAAQ